MATISSTSACTVYTAEVSALQIYRRWLQQHTDQTVAQGEKTDLMSGYACTRSTWVPLLWRGANTSLGWRLSTLMRRTPLLANVVVGSGDDVRHPVGTAGCQMYETG